jgi:hypothetical protein
MCVAQICFRLGMRCFGICWRGDDSGAEELSPSDCYLGLVELICAVKLSMGAFASSTGRVFIYLSATKRLRRKRQCPLSSQEL